ncbi:MULTISPECIES: NAD(P)-dependent oxidoreductase [unclassified Achromobacter]|uniref:NAD-dependent epimerase/dehydratase family protein n=1 Tax=unclassified Achromobacter TaxID=2626865 RepID=UPI000B5196A4|nr:MULTISPECIES: NAD(P)-dependent oxidoreductase [unclassified Achromobacter]OWT74293.1 capsular biosynthesis protein [Achromobacter sp. HZ34]OWT78760.1 capsular biosynthesis protein [Achromobacter sp. HZ28]
MKQRVLVLGADEYVGRRVIAALAASDWAEPVACVRRPVQLHDNVRQVAVDITDRIAVARALSAVDAAVNCVAGAPARILGGARALSVALDTRGGDRVRVVHFSSMVVYGPARGAVDETQPVAEGMGGYAGARVGAERLLAGRDGVVTLRPGCVYGPGSPHWSQRIARLLRARRIGDLGAAGDGNSNLVYIDDVLAAVRTSLLAPASQVANGPVYNLAMAHAPDWNRYFLEYARALGAVPLRRVGARRLQLETHVAAPALKVAQIGLPLVGVSVPPPIPPSLKRLWSQDMRLVSKRAEDTLGLDWTPLAQGVAACAAADGRHAGLAT